MKRHSPITLWFGWLTATFILCGGSAAQVCSSGTDIDAPVRSAVERAAQQYVTLAQHGDYAGLRAAAIPSLAAGFSGIEGAVGAHQKDIQGAVTMSDVYLLDAPSGNAARSEFYCGIFNSPQRVTMIFQNLPAGKYAVVTAAVSGDTPAYLTFVLQQSGANWQIAGLTIAPQSIGGHDSNWFLAQARAYRQNKANLSAYLYYLEAWNLAAPAQFEITAGRDKIVDEMQAVQPATLPSPQSPMTLSAAGKSFRVTHLFPDASGNDLVLVVKYEALTDLSNSAAAFADNTALIKALLAQYPEFRNAFAAVVARAVAPNGNDYGSMTPMKDVK